MWGGLASLDSVPNSNLKMEMKCIFVLILLTDFYVKKLSDTKVKLSL
jgi:hypothetical protein